MLQGVLQKSLGLCAARAAIWGRAGGEPGLPDHPGAPRGGGGGGKTTSGNGTGLKTCFKRCRTAI
jgi:hypothetical protein